MSYTVYKSKEESYHPYTHGQAEQLLPAVGDRLMRTPAALDDQYGRGANPKRCVVVQVNPEALWYRVKFIDSGLYQCIKVSEV